MDTGLLPREEFSRRVLARHGGKCCVPECPRPAADAHHILNRNLFHSPTESGGYFLDNGANLCGPHHLAAEQTTITTHDLREWCGITTPRLPEHLSPDTDYDTWGNPVLPDGTRLHGEMFHTAACQRATAAVRHLFSTRVKYPRTFHLPWSPGRSADDKTLHDLTGLSGTGDVVVTLKMDGENTTIYSGGFSHARSTTPAPHPSRAHVRALAGRIGMDLPDGWRINGENLWATHSIAYTDLPGHFLVFALWDRDRCLPWDETAEWAGLLDLPTVPVLYRGPMPSRDDLGGLFAPHASSHEGYVVRPAGGFTLASFAQVVGKYVRAEHVTTDQHWLNGPMRTNLVAATSPG